MVFLGPQSSCGAGVQNQHTRLLVKAVSDTLKSATNCRLQNCVMDTTSRRTATLHKLFLRAKEIRELGPDPCIFDHTDPLSEREVYALEA